jgi:3-oxoacyl-[acyl-carrier protein] reductase
VDERDGTGGGSIPRAATEAEATVDLGLADRHVVVTGGSSGLGLAAARVLVAEGARVTIVARDEQRLTAAAEGLGGDVATVAVDITDDDAPARIVNGAVAAHGPLEGLVLSHGGPPPGSASTLGDAALDIAIAVSLRGPLRLMRDVASVLDEGGAVVVITSTSTHEPIAGLASSNATRPGVWGYVKTLADELGPTGVRLNIIVPGRFDTARLASFEDDLALRGGRTRAQVRADVAARIPLRRLGHPDELGRVAAFLVSPAASYVTGSAWTVDGGAIRGL